MKLLALIAIMILQVSVAEAAEPQSRRSWVKGLTACISQLLVGGSSAARGWVEPIRDIERVSLSQPEFDYRKLEKIVIQDALPVGPYLHHTRLTQNSIRFLRQHQEQLSAEELAALWRRLAMLIHTHSRNWGMEEFETSDGSYLFIGEEGGEALIITQDRQMYRGKISIWPGSSSFVNGVWQADYQWLYKLPPLQ
jgi:hypothetical protein